MRKEMGWPSRGGHPGMASTEIDPFQSSVLLPLPVMGVGLLKSWWLGRKLCS